MSLPVSTVGVGFERTTALLDTKWMIDERGEEIKIYERGESDVTRDKYNSIKVKKTDVVELIINAFPQLNPTEKQLEKAGLRDMVDVILTTAMQDWIDNVIEPREFDIVRNSVVFRNETYKIKNIGFINHFYDTQLNVTLGIVK